MVQLLYIHVYGMQNFNISNDNVELFIKLCVSVGVSMFMFFVFDKIVSALDWLSICMHFTFVYDRLTSTFPWGMDFEIWLRYMRDENDIVHDTRDITITIFIHMT